MFSFQQCASTDLLDSPMTSATAGQQIVIDDAAGKQLCITLHVRKAINDVAEVASGRLAPAPLRRAAKGVARSVTSSPFPSSRKAMRFMTAPAPSASGEAKALLPDIVCLQVASPLLRTRCTIDLDACTDDTLDERTISQSALQRKEAFLKRTALGIGRSPLSSAVASRCASPKAEKRMSLTRSASRRRCSYMATQPSWA